MFSSCCAVLFSSFRAVLRWAELHCAVLCFAVPCRATLCRTVRCCAAMRCDTLYGAMLCCAVLCCAVLKQLCQVPRCCSAWLGLPQQVAGDEDTRLAKGEKPPELDEDTEHEADHIEGIFGSLCWCELANTVSQPASRANRGTSRLSQMASRVTQRASRGKPMGTTQDQA